MCRPVPTWSRLVAPTSAAPGLGVELVQLLSSAVQSALCMMLAWTAGLQLLHSALYIVHSGFNFCALVHWQTYSAMESGALMH